MNRRWGIALFLFIVLTPIQKAHGTVDTYLQVNLFPDIFSAGEAASLFGCIANSNPHYKPKILPGDTFKISISSSAGTVTSTGSVVVDSAELLATDFAIAPGGAANEIFVNYVGTAAKRLYAGESFCLEVSVQASNTIGPFELSVVPPASLAAYGDRLFALGSIIDFPVGPASQGPQGPPGPQGPQGATGPQGPAGAQGPQGTVGPQGAAGATGAQGPQGTTGAQGPAGPQGVQGAAGADGTSIIFRGAWNLTDNYLVNDVVTDLGETWIAVAANTNSQPSNVNADWSKLAAKGADGVTGPQGPTGATGPQGAQGQQGHGTSRAAGPAGYGVRRGHKVRKEQPVRKGRRDLQERRDRKDQQGPMARGFTFRDAWNSDG